MTVFLLSVVNFLLGGMLIVLLWGWFVVPLGVPGVSFMQALGIDILWTYFSLKPFDVFWAVQARQKTTEDRLKERAFVLFAKFFWLALGALFHVAMLRGW